MTWIDSLLMDLVEVKWEVVKDAIPEVLTTFPNWVSGVVAVVTRNI